MRVETPPILVPLISGGRPADMALVTSGFFAGPAIGDRSSPAILLAVFSGAGFAIAGIAASPANSGRSGAAVGVAAALAAASSRARPCSSPDGGGAEIGRAHV